MFEQLFRHPEWKRLYDAMLPLIESGKREFSYDELTELLGGLDARGDRGRAQFRRFAREILRDRNIHFECSIQQGYRIVAANEHAPASMRQVQRAKRRLRQAKTIAVHTDLDELTPGEQKILTDLHVRFAMLEAHVSKEVREVRKLIAAPARLPSPLLSEKPETRQ